MDLQNVAYTNIKVKGAVAEAKGYVDTELEAVATAYDVWLGRGNDGTIDDFIASLKGEQGDVSVEQMNTAIDTALQDWGDLT